MATDDEEVDEIRRGAIGHLYIDEWFLEKGVNDEKIGDRLDMNRTTIFRWRTEQRRLNPMKIAKLAHALDIKPTDLWHPPPPKPAKPPRKSLDVVLKDAPDETHGIVLDLAEKLAARK